MRGKCRLWCRVLWFWAGFWLLWPGLQAQEAAPSLVDGPTAEQIGNEIAALEKLGAEDKNATQALVFYREAAKWLKATEEHANRVRELKAFIDGEAVEEARLDKELDKAKGEIPDTDLKKWQKLGADDLQQALTQQLAEVADKQNQVSELQGRIAAQASRADQLVKDLASAKGRLDEVQKALKQPPGVVAEAAAVTQARRFALLAEQRELVARINKLDLERVSAPARDKRQSLARELAEVQLRQAEQRVEWLQRAIADRRQAEAAKVQVATDQARQEAVGKHELVREAAEMNTQLSQRLARVNAQMREVQERLQRETELLKNLEARYSRISQQLEFSGLEQAMGQLLYAERQRLQNVKFYERRVAEQRRALTAARLEQFDIDDQLQAMSDIQGVVKQQIESKADTREWQSLTADERTRIQGELGNSLADRHQLLSKLKEAYASDVQLLATLELKQQEVLKKAQQYLALLNKNLWLLPSSVPVDAQWLWRLVQALPWLADPGLWQGTLAALVSQSMEHPLPAFATLILPLLLFAARGWLRRRLVYLARDLGKVTRDHFSYSLRAVLVTALLALPWTALSAGLGWLLSHQTEAGFGSALGVALSNLSPYIFMLEFLRCLFLDKGLAESHFLWSSRVRRVFSANLRWYVPICIGISVLVIITHWSINVPEIYRATLGRLAFVLNCLLFALLAWRLLNPRRGAFTEVESIHWGSWTLVDLGLILCLLIPLSLASAALLGYYFTALELNNLFFRALFTLVGSFLLYSLAVRWQTLAARRLAFERAQSRRQSERETRSYRAAADMGGEMLPEVAELEVDLEEVHSQSRTMLRLGVWVAFGLALMWTLDEVTPVISALEDITLWSHSMLVGGAVKVVPITAKAILSAILVTLLTMVAARNLPGLLEISLLQPLKLEAGNRYAIITILRYLILTLGFLVVVNLFGVGWGDIQWLVAAMGVGLGFGLKDIFANFISGLIILFERPIRVGDIVTLGSVSGTVSRIHIRSTTITDWDNKEMVIPNQSLVTQSVINWTLSDQITRVTFRVGIAYGSNTDQALQLMMGVIKANPLVLADPKPTVLFIDFGDSALIFDVRVFVRDRSHRAQVSHELHMALEKVLREHGIEIPFPQRDLNIRSLAPEVALALGGRGGSEPSLATPAESGTIRG